MVQYFSNTCLIFIIIHLIIEVYFQKVQSIEHTKHTKHTRHTKQLYSIETITIDIMSIFGISKACSSHH